MKIRRLNREDLREIFYTARREFFKDNEKIPDKYIQFAAACTAEYANKFCEVNGLELDKSEEVKK